MCKIAKYKDENYTVLKAEIIIDHAHDIKYL